MNMDIWVLLAAILVLTLYSFTFGMLVHNVFRYLCPMRIKKPLITLFYVFTSIKLMVMLTITVYPFIKHSTKPTKVSDFLALINFVAENMAGTIIIMQWLHLAYSI